MGSLLWSVLINYKLVIIIKNIIIQVYGLGVGMKPLIKRTGWGIPRGTSQLVLLNVSCYKKHAYTVYGLYGWRSEQFPRKLQELSLL